ncbi:MAG: ABC transporter permease [Gemmatimonadaceae bacterium]
MRSDRAAAAAGAIVLPLLALLLLAAVVAALLAALLRLAGYDAATALGALWTGSVGSTYALTSATLVRATPLVLAGLAVALAFRAGVWNIGAEGQLMMGAAAAAAAALAWAPALGHLAWLAALAAGAGAGALWAGIAAVLRRRFGVLEVISTIMLNFLALHALSYLVRGPLQEPFRINPQTSSIAQVARLPRLLPWIPGARVSWGWVIAVAAAVALWWTMRATAAGFRVRLAGANPSAARVSGRVDVDRVTTRAFLASGALAGLAGAVEVTGVTYALYENISPGYGYTAIAVALLARLDFLGIVATGIFFGALESGALAMQRDAGVPAVIVSVIEAGLILLALAAGLWRGSVGIRRVASPVIAGGGP